MMVEHLRQFSCALGEVNAAEPRGINEALKYPLRRRLRAALRAVKAQNGPRDRAHRGDDQPDEDENEIIVVDHVEKVANTPEIAAMLGHGQGRLVREATKVD